MLKRGRRGHDPAGAAGTKPGELAVCCPVCPRPGINLPEDWENASKEDRCVFDSDQQIDETDWIKLAGLYTFFSWHSTRVFE